MSRATVSDAGGATLDSVLIVGAGLLGTSVGLALAASGVDVHLDDLVSENIHIAVGRQAGRAWDGRARVDLAMVAVPPRVTASQLRRLQQLDVARTYTHVSSIQTQVQADVETLQLDLSCIVGGHPMAGRASSGPRAASFDLFVGRPWCLCPMPGTTEQAVEDVRALALRVGAVPTVLSPGEHDQAVALVSHLPQVVSSALAGLLGDPAFLQLAGPGLIDTTRIAGSDPGLWTDVLTGNAGPITPLVERLVVALQQLSSALSAPPSADRDSRVQAFLSRGVAGRALVPVKRGAQSADFDVVAVRLGDRPGELGRLLAAAGDLRVNVEDVRVDHLPGRPDGVVSLTVHAGRSAELAAGLTATEWVVEHEQSDVQI